MTNPIRLALQLDGNGAHPAAWRQTTASPGNLLTSRRIRETITLAETAGFTAAILGGGHLPPGAFPNVVARLDPLQQAAFAGPLTTRIGLVPEVEVTYIEPFHTANQLATLDHVSRGRGGWLVRATGDATAARAFGWSPFDSTAAISREASDVIEVNRRLWDSWEDDAVIRDTATWRYIDRDKLHYADFTGETFSVKGTNYVPRPPQGQLPIFSHDGLVDPHQVDVTIVHALVLEDIPAAASDARTRGATLVATDLEIVLDSKGELAATRLERLDAFTAWAESGNPRLVGTASDLIAAITWLAKSVDIVRLIPAVIDIDLPELRYAVLPALLRAGVAVAPQTGATLRDSLGLEIPANRYVTN